MIVSWHNSKTGKKTNAAVTESEQTLENKLIVQLETLGFVRVRIDDKAALLVNLKKQLEKHNKTKLSGAEFKQILNKLAKGNIFEKARILRDNSTISKTMARLVILSQSIKSSGAKTNTR